MTRTQQKLIDQAIHLYGSISPCSGRTFLESFTSDGRRIMFWFNDDRGNTHALIEAEPVTA